MEGGRTWNESGYPPVTCDMKCENWEEFLIPITNYQWVRLFNMEEDEIRNLIKTLLMEKGPLDAGIAHTWDWHKWCWDHDPDDYYPYPGPCTTSINHEIVIVGWKDDPSIGQGGYWICKNCYGTEWGYDGFFNIEYGSNHLGTANGDVSWVDYDPESFSNWIPTVDAGGPYTADAEEDIVFDATKSFDHEGEIISYTWDFGDETTGQEVSPIHTYPQEGVYSVTLMVTDNMGNTANDTTWAFIGRTNGAPSNPTISGETQGRNGTTYNYTFSALDPDGDDVFYYVYWGSFYWWGWYGPYPSEEDFILNHMWPVNETYIIHVKAKDMYGAESDWSTLEVKMGRGKPVISPFQQFLEQHPHLFPVLRHLEGL